MTNEEKLRKENEYLKSLLNKNNIPYDTSFISIEDNNDVSTHKNILNLIDTTQKSEELPLKENIDVIDKEYITEQHALFLYSLFKGRKDVYSKRSVMKNGKAAYFPVCNNFWKDNVCPKRYSKKTKCMDCAKKDWALLNQRALKAHLLGYKDNCSDVVGIYPLLLDNTCNFLVFDFDNHDSDKEKSDKAAFDLVTEVNAIRNICKTLNIPCYTERSRSGKGVHIWFFFNEPIEARLARSFGSSLLTKGSEFINQKSFVSYDRMLPFQDTLPKGGLGNLIALPLQGKALEMGNSAFIDENFVAYKNQWEYLKTVQKIDKSFIEEKVKEWSGDGVLGKLSVEDEDNNLNENSNNSTSSIKQKTKPWEKRKPFILYKEDVEGTLNITRANMIYIEVKNTKPRFQNTLRRLSSFSNPNFYKNLKLGLSNRLTPRIITSYFDINEYLALPRGKWEEIEELLNNANISYKVYDEREKGKKIDVDFIGELYKEQQEASNAMLSFDNGILGAATAFGKTSVGSYLIAKRKVNTLILVHTREIMKNWEEDLEKFLDINEELPSYTTPSGKTRKRSSIIGTLYSSHNSLNGLIDIALLPSLVKNGEVDDLVKDYGMVIMDECHHGAAFNAESILRQVNAKYVYGLTATPKRDDGMEQKVIMQFGKIRYRFTAKDKAKLQGITHTLVPRFTSLVNIGEKWNINEAYQNLIHNDDRNILIIKDIIALLKDNKTPLVLTKHKEHITILNNMLTSYIKDLCKKEKNEKLSKTKIVILQGGKSTKERDATRSEIRNIQNDEYIVLLAIDKYIGEGFNFPRLDTLLLTSPISFEGNVEQYAGRLHRDYEGKNEVSIYDYVDIHVRTLENMYLKRLRTYNKIGYVIKNETNSKGTMCKALPSSSNKNRIYDKDNYEQVFNNDLVLSSKTIVISSPILEINSVDNFIKNTEDARSNGVKIILLTLENKNSSYKEDYDKCIRKLYNVGIYVKRLRYLYEHFAIIDSSIVWHGNINLLAIPLEDENILRIEDREIAEALVLFSAKKMDIEIKQ